MKWFLRGETKKKILFIGDDITQGIGYADKIKYYFEKLNPLCETEIIKSGVDGETISGLSEPCLFDRLDEAISCKPDAVVFCYGMSDGIYHPFSNKRFTDFKNAVQKLIDILSSENIKIVAMTPPPFDAAAIANNKDSEEDYGAHSPYEGYDEVMQKYAGYITSLEGDKRIEAIIDLHSILKDFIEKKREDGSAYRFADGITPDDEAHDLIARTVLKELFNITLTAPIGKFDDSTYHGFERKNFYFMGREATFILPKKCAEGRPWIWRAEFLGAFDKADISMLEHGWGLAYLNLSDMYGCAEAVELMHKFQLELVKMFSLREKGVLFGFSRGGLYTLNYTAKYPECIAGIYLDAPVIDIYSWPGGFGAGSSNPKSMVWLECKMLYGAEDKKKNSYKETLPAKFDVLLKNNIPVMYVAGGADSVVPYLENGVYLVDTYLKNGGKIKIYIESWRDHHPHSLEEPQEIVRYIIDEMN